VAAGSALFHFGMPKTRRKIFIVQHLTRSQARKLLRSRVPPQPTYFLRPVRQPTSHPRTRTVS